MGGKRQQDLGRQCRIWQSNVHAVYWAEANACCENAAAEARQSGKISRTLTCLSLEAQQRHFSYRTMLVATVLPNYLPLAFMGYRTIIAICCKMGIGQLCLCEPQCDKGASHHFGEPLTSRKKHRVIWGIAAIVSQYRAIWGRQVFGAHGAAELGKVR